MRVWLLRHGETDWNARRKYLGRTDLPLSGRGRLALIRADFAPDRVYVSPLGRTAETAELLFAAFASLVDGAAASGGSRLVIVAHGGTQMASLERFALPRRDYFDWNGPLGGGFVLDAARWREERVLTLLDTVQYTGGEGR